MQMKRIKFIVWLLLLYKIYAQDTVKVGAELSPEQKAQMEYNQGLSELKKENYRKALDCFNKALELKPDFDKALYNRSLAYAGLKEFHSALNDISSLLAKNPKNSDAWFAKSMIFYHQTKRDSALFYLDKTTESDPKHHEAHYYKGLIFTEKKRF